MCSSRTIKQSTISLTVALFAIHIRSKTKLSEFITCHDSYPTYKSFDNCTGLITHTACPDCDLADRYKVRSPSDHRLKRVEY